MRRTALLVPALALLVPAPARAGEPAGVLCAYWTMTGADGRQAGELDAGPLVLDDDPAGHPVWGSVTCTLQVGWGDARHSAPDDVTATSPTTPAVVQLAPTPFAVDVPADEGVHLCTRVDVAGVGTFYWESAEWYAPDGGESGRWSTDPDAYCVPPPTHIDPPGEPHVDTFVFEYVEAIRCPLLAYAYPPQGDMPGVWDCPPYDS